VPIPDRWLDGELDLDPNGLVLTGRDRPGEAPALLVETSLPRLLGAFGRRAKQPLRGL